MAKNYSISTNPIVTGSLWGFISVFLQKFFGVATYLTFAWLLTPEEIGIGTLAITICAFVTIIYPGASIDSLMGLVSPSKSLIFACSLLSTISAVFYLILILICGSFVAYWWKIPVLYPLLIVISLKLIVETFSYRPIGQLLLTFKFKQITYADLFFSSAVLISSLILAFAGAGVWSMIAPLLVGHIFRTIYLINLCPPTIHLFELYSSIRKILPGYLFGGFQHYFIGLTQVADYLAIGFFCSKISLGIYTIAYQLASISYILFSITIGRVVQATFLAQNNLPHVQFNSFRHIQLQAMIFAAPIGISFAAISPPLCNFLFPQKFSGIEEPLSLLSLGMVAANPIGISMGYLRAKSSFKLLLYVQAFHALILIISCFFAAWFGGINAVALSVFLCLLLVSSLYIAVINFEKKLIYKLNIWPIIPVLIAIPCFLPCVFVCWLRTTPYNLFVVFLSFIFGMIFYFILIRFKYLQIVTVIEREILTRIRSSFMTRPR